MLKGGVSSWPYTHQLVNGVRLMSRVRKHLAKEPAWGQVLTLAWGSYLDMIINSNVYCPGCPPRGTRVPHGGHNFRLMALCHGGALLHSKNNAMFITYFKP